MVFNIKFSLNKGEKIKFLELLILIGSILGSFNIPINLLWIFILFLLLSLFSYVIIKKSNKLDFWGKSVIFLVSIFFSAILFYNYGVSLLSIPNFIIIKIIILFLWYIVSAILIYTLLTK